MITKRVMGSVSFGHITTYKGTCSEVFMRLLVLKYNTGYLKY